MTVLFAALIGKSFEARQGNVIITFLIMHLIDNPFKLH